MSHEKGGEAVIGFESREQGQALLKEVLQNPMVLADIRELARFTSSEKREGGLAVYHTENGFISSGVDYPDMEEYKKIFESTGNTLSAMMGPYQTYDSIRLSRVYDEILGDYDPDKLRDDIFLFVHSHPIMDHESEDQAKEFLRPSLPDLEAWENYSIKNPEMVAGILTTDGPSTQLLLYKSDSTGNHYPRYLMLGGDIGRCATLKAMRESHINITEITVPERMSEDYAASVEDAVRGLYK